MVIVKTERLILRYFEPIDSEAMMDVFGDAEVMRFGDGVQTREWVEAWLRTCLENYQRRGFGPYAVVEQSTGDVIGYCGLFYFPDMHGQPEIELGYRLRRAAWGQGYATEAARLVRDYAFHTLHIKRLIALIDPDNVPSIRVAEKIGMHYESEVMLEGYDHPDHVYVILSE
ncbi:MAG: GNAT family N-acetyltransferase [Byssovorax cruenta]